MITINGKKVGRNIEVPDRAHVEIRSVQSLKDLIGQAGVDENRLRIQTYAYAINGRDSYLEWSALSIKVNGQPAALDDPVCIGSVVEYSVREFQPCISDVIGGETDQQSLEVTVNGQKAVLPVYHSRVLDGSRPVQMADPLKPGMRLTVEPVEQSVILSDVFNIIDFKVKTNGRLFMTVDGNVAGFTTPVYHRSIIEIRWE